jgi:hypothetical protein
MGRTACTEPQCLYKGAHFLLELLLLRLADPSGRAVKGVGLRPLACRVCGIEPRRGHGCLFLVTVVCC